MASSNPEVKKATVSSRAGPTAAAEAEFDEPLFRQLLTVMETLQREGKALRAPSLARYILINELEGSTAELAKLNNELAALRAAEQARLLASPESSEAILSNAIAEAGVSSARCLTLLRRESAAFLGSVEKCGKAQGRCHFRVSPPDENPFVMSVTGAELVRLCLPHDGFNPDRLTPGQLADVFRMPRPALLINDRLSLDLPATLKKRIDHCATRLAGVQAIVELRQSSPIYAAGESRSDELLRAIDRLQDELAKAAQAALPNPREDEIEESLEALREMELLAGPDESVLCTRPSRTEPYSLRVGEARLVTTFGDAKWFRLEGQRRNDVLRLVPVPGEPRGVGHYRGLLTLPESLVCSEDGVPLCGSKGILAAEIFEKVRIGVPVIASPSHPHGVCLRRSSDANGSARDPRAFAPRMRTWELEFLEAQKPDDTMQGEVFVTMLEWIAHRYGTIGIVEAKYRNDESEEATATYVVEWDKLSELRDISRARLRDEKPDGLIRRVIHARTFADEPLELSRARWCAQILKFIEYGRGQVKS